MFKALAKFVLVSTLVISTDAIANAVPELSLEAKVSKANVVIIGQAISNESNSEKVYARVQVKSTLKGKPAKVLLVLTRGGIAEFAPMCCTPGQSYLFFLEDRGGGKYQSVNGRFGIYPM